MKTPLSEISYRRANFNSESELQFLAEMDSRIPLEFDPLYQWNEKNIQQRLEHYKRTKEDDFFGVAIFQGKIVGFHALNIIPYPPALRIATISTLWVDPGFRKQGIARALKLQAEAWAKKQELAFIQTNVHKDNSKMLSLNNSMGFETSYFTMRKRL